MHTITDNDRVTMQGCGSLNYAEWFAAARQIDPLDDLAPWVPADTRPLDLDAIEYQIAERDWPGQSLVAAPQARSRAISIAPEAIRLAGTGLGCVFTVEETSGHHATYRISRAKTGVNPPLFAALLTGRQNDDPWSYTYVGIVDDRSFSLVLTRKSTIRDGRAVRLQQALQAILYGRLPGSIDEIRGSGKCSRCGRMLTTVESLARGIGPECSEKGDGK